jgi:16S rRNA (uracil1498-N3)-methyltransferase
MPRFFIEKERLHGNEALLSQKEAHHIRNVLRMKKRDDLILFDSEGNEYKGKINSIGPKEVRVSLTEQVWVSREPPMQLVLLQSLIKGDRMDLIVQKGCELGINWIVPVLSNRSIPRYNSLQASHRRERWEKIALEASKQCGRARAPYIGDISPLEEALKRLPSSLGLRILLWELADRVGLKGFLKGLKGEHEKGVALLVGPEGGLTKEEVKWAEDNGFVAVSLGRRILRTETASLAALSLLQYELGDLGSI